MVSSINKVDRNKWKVLTGAQKAKIALEAVNERKTVNEIAQELGVHLTQIGLWKKALLENASHCQLLRINLPSIEN